MKNTRLLFVIWMLFLVLPQGYSQEKKEDSSVLGQVNGFLSKHVEKEAVIIGVGTRLEIWNKETWQKCDDNISADEIAQNMTMLGI